MTNITGKIYQMKNADRTENRFPRTVIEAVLGLNSYLQDQFSALAGIYMPIEGITESKTGQEFVYRATPNTINAKSFTLDRIQGKSLAWNQLVNRDTSAGFNSGGLTGSFSNGVWSYTGTPATAAIALLPVGSYGKVIANHKYYVNIEGNHSAGKFIWVAYYSGASQIFNKVKGIFVPTQDSNDVEPVVQNLTTGVAFTASLYYTLVDLTLLYGSEIDGMTDAEILAKYESEYPGYHDYSAGKLISNDAKQLETVGRNVWDEEWESGAYSNWIKIASPGRIRCKNPIPCFPSTMYKVTVVGEKSNTTFEFNFLDDNGNFISKLQVTNYTFETPSNCHYFVFCTLTSYYGTTYNHDICINLSDAYFNGQYEPYRKSTLPINLDDFWVKDGQGNQVHITGGLKSAGSVRDEIVGNKYIKRVGSVDLGSLSWWYSSGRFSALLSTMIQYASGSSVLANICCSKYSTITAVQWYAKSAIGIAQSAPGYGAPYTICVNDTNYSDAATFKTAMDGVILCYELAEPIEYDLVEPLIYTMKAGTTEARISPNSDGLSAPFCCDMTYSANDNNDAGNAQYAATAGRLLNAHKIWGQDFNGSEDVNGNLVSNGILQGTQLKSTVPTGTAPLVVSSTTTVANLVAEKASKLLTARTIWGQSFDGSDNISGAISNITTISASGLATISGGIALGTSTKAQAARLVWDENNDAWHLQGNLYADGFIAAGGLNEYSPSVDISPYVIECNNWANSGRGYILQTVFSEAIAKYKAGYQVHSNGYNTTNTYLLTGINETSLELYFNGDSGFTLSVES